jgi:hypothetical protein
MKFFTFKNGCAGPADVIAGGAVQETHFICGKFFFEMLMPSCYSLHFALQADYIKMCAHIINAK